MIPPGRENAIVEGPKKLLKRIEELEAENERLRGTLDYLRHVRVDGLGRTVQDVIPDIARVRVARALRREEDE